MSPIPSAPLPDLTTPEAALRLGPFLVDGGGRLWPAPGASPRFLLRWRDRDVRAELHPSTADHPAPDRLALGRLALGSLSLGSLVAKVPSSAELAGQGASRETLFATLRTLAPLLPPAWRLTLCPDHHIGVSAGEAMEMPVSAVGLVTALSVFLLALAPYLDLLEQQGAAPPSRALAAGAG